ncbi:MAG: hypothetical protein BECKG1743E_GA0114224_109991 [Candidatus Kentron sp. G]|nr:MAG: hypothetical protein BECKG1743E_GA0114224_109991 [Candidatus Kentron sp. G]
MLYLYVGRYPRNNASRNTNAFMVRKQGTSRAVPQDIVASEGH